jgi:hypothetical protein
MRLLPRIIILQLALTLINCSEAEFPIIAFTTTTSDVVEGNTLAIPLSVAIPSGVTPIVKLTGTATAKVDFNWAISADGRELIFETLSDDVFDDETAIIEITGFNGDAAVGFAIKHTVNIADPGLLVDLTWIARDGGSADLDIVILKETSPRSGEYSEVFVSEAFGSSETTVVHGDYANANYAIALVYYDGNSDEVDFTLSLTATKGTINNNTNGISFNGTLTQHHRDPDAQPSYILFKKDNYNYSNFSSLIIDYPLEVILSWNAGNGTAGDVDMDLTLYYFNPSTSQYEVIDRSDSPNSPTEKVTLALSEPNGTYGLRYEYFSGTSNSLLFTATFALNGAGNFLGTSANTLFFNGIYTLSNVSLMTDENISQTFVKIGSNFSNFSTVSIPVSGSDAQVKDDVKMKNKVSKARTVVQAIKREKGFKGLSLNLNR